MDLSHLDELFDAAGGEPPLLLAHFDDRVRYPLRDLHLWLEQITGEVIDPSQVNELAERGWFPVAAGNIEDDELGVPLFVPERLALLLRLEREGWTHAELRAFTEYEDSMITDIYTTDELAYDRSDYEVIIDHLQDQISCLKNTLRVIDEPGWTPMSGSWRLSDDRPAVVREFGKARATLDYVRKFENVDELPASVRKFAFKLRFAHEYTRIMLNEGDREKMRSGYSFFVEFRGPRNPAAGDFGEGIEWGMTLRRPWASEESLPIRLPGIILRGATPQLTDSPHPSKYDEIWKAYQLEDYFRIRAEVADTKVCLHCLAALPEDSAPTRKFCGERCRNAAKGRRHRERNPDGVLDSQIRYYSSLGQMRANSAKKK